MLTWSAQKNKSPGVDELGARPAINTAKMSEGGTMQFACEGKFLSQQVLFFNVNPTPGVVVDKGPHTQMKY